MVRTDKPNDKKLRELIVYIAAKCEGDDSFGATKLNKALFFSDFLSYLHHGQSITGHDYQKLDHGPAPRALMPITRDMVDRGEIVQQERLLYGTHKQKRTIALRDARLDSFAPEEIAMVDLVISGLWHHTAKSVSDMSHQFVGWEVASYGETIPYEVALVGCRKPTAREIERGRELEGSARVRRKTSC